MGNTRTTQSIHSKTITNKLGTTQWLMNWEKQNNHVISDLIHREILLTENQL